MRKKIFCSTSSYVSLSKLTAIKWKTNEALSQPATSSSVYGNDSSLRGAHYATNGAKSLVSTEIFASQPETSPWLKVQLIGLQMITFVRVYNRRDVLGKLLERCLINSSHTCGLFLINQSFILNRRKIP